MSVTSGDLGSGVADCDLQNIGNPRGKCGSFVDATSYIVETLTNKANISI